VHIFFTTDFALRKKKNDEDDDEHMCNSSEIIFKLRQYQPPCKDQALSSIEKEIKNSNRALTDKKLYAGEHQ